MTTLLCLTICTKGMLENKGSIQSREQAVQVWLVRERRVRERHGLSVGSAHIGASSNSDPAPLVDSDCS